MSAAKKPKPWTGEPVSSLLIVHAGSDVELCALSRYVRALASLIVMPIWLRVPPDLLELVRGALVNDDVQVSAGDEPPLQAQIGTQALPAIFRRKKWPLPIAVEVARGRELERRRVPLRVGVWGARDLFPLEGLVPRVSLLDVSPTELAPGTPRERRGSALMDAVALLDTVDLVVTADELAAHVCGNLGVPCFAALMAGEDARGYAAVRVFRMARPADLHAYGAIVAAIAEMVR